MLRRLPIQAPAATPLSLPPWGTARAQRPALEMPCICLSYGAQAEPAIELGVEILTQLGKQGQTSVALAMLHRAETSIAIAWQQACGAQAFAKVLLDTEDDIIAPNVPRDTWVVALSNALPVKYQPALHVLIASDFDRLKMPAATRAMALVADLIVPGMRPELARLLVEGLRASLSPRQDSPH